MLFATRSKVFTYSKNRIEELNISFHPCYTKNPWFLEDSTKYLYNFNKSICEIIRIDFINYEQIMKNFNGKIIGSNIFFKSYEDAKNAKDWIISILTLNKLEEKTKNL